MSTLDVKFSVWERVEFDNEDQMNEILEKLKSKELVTGYDVMAYIENYSDTLEETLEELSLEDNGGSPTMEILDDNGDVIWHNGAEAVVRTIYYVVEPELQDIDGFKETTGWKNVGIYQVLGNGLQSMGTFEIGLSDDTEEEILSYIMEDINENEIIKLEKL